MKIPNINSVLSALASDSFYMLVFKGVAPEQREFDSVSSFPQDTLLWSAPATVSSNEDSWVVNTSYEVSTGEGTPQWYALASIDEAQRVVKLLVGVFSEDGPALSTDYVNKGVRYRVSQYRLTFLTLL